MTCRSRALFRDEVAPRAALAAPALCRGHRRWSSARWRRWRCCSPMTGASRRSSSAPPPRCSCCCGSSRALLMAAARRAPRPRSTRVRLAIANIHRPGALTPSVVLSLGLGLALLVTVIEIDGNLRRQFSAALPDKAPSFYFVDIPSAEAERFDAFIRERAPRRHARARADAARAHRVGQRHHGRGPQAAAGRRLGAAKRPRHHLCGRRPGRLARGRRANGGGPTTRARRWSRSRSSIADGLGLKLGDTVTVNVLGRNITAHDRQSAHASTGRASASISCMVFSPGAFARRAAYPYRHADLSRRRHARAGRPRCSRPRRTPSRRSPPCGCKEAIDAVGHIVANLVAGDPRRQRR